jgi:methylglutaconyl-CoA hydratase
MSLIVSHHEGIGFLTLNRPALHNAFDDNLIRDLTAAFTEAGRDPATRFVVLQANGTTFSAGADLSWMRRMQAYTPTENLADARALANLMHVIDTCPKPTIARVHGSAFAGGLGLIACCDIAVAVPAAQFAVTEVRLGLIPAVISPYLVRAMGARAARRWFLTGERFPASAALALGLIHEVVEPEELDAAVHRHIDALRMAPPGALAAATKLVVMVDRPINEAVIESTAQEIAILRVAPEGRKGIAAFLEKRKPDWQA